MLDQFGDPIETRPTFSSSILAPTRKIISQGFSLRVVKSGVVIRIRLVNAKCGFTGGIRKSCAKNGLIIHLQVPKVRPADIVRITIPAVMYQKVYGDFNGIMRWQIAQIKEHFLIIIIAKNSLFVKFIDSAVFNKVKISFGKIIGIYHHLLLKNILAGKAK